VPELLPLPAPPVVGVPLPVDDPGAVVPEPVPGALRPVPPDPVPVPGVLVPAPGVPVPLPVPVPTPLPVPVPFVAGVHGFTLTPLFRVVGLAVVPLP